MNELQVRAMELLQGKSFEELVTYWNELNKRGNFPEMNELIMNQMEIVDAEKFEQWLDN